MGLVSVKRRSKLGGGCLHAQGFGQLTEQDFLFGRGGRLGELLADVLNRPQVFLGLDEFERIGGEIRGDSIFGKRLKARRQERV